MQQIEGVVKRKDNPNLSCGVLITKDDDGNRTWKKEGTGGLPLNHNSGVWEYRLQTKNLVFLDDNGDRNEWVFVFGEVPSDFLSVFCTKIYAGEGMISPDMDDIVWSLGVGCA
jgi:hypothetical protein